MPPHQFTWTYVSDAGQRYTVGLFHSVREGHLMVYCNQKVVLIDFKVFDTRSYPLFLDDELFHVNIERKNGKYFYGFRMDKEADTPRNQARRLIEKKHWKQTLIFVALLALAVTAVTIIGRSQKEDQGDPAGRAELILHHGKMTEGKVEGIYQHEDQTTVRYSFIVNGQSYSGREALPPMPNALLPNGLPLKEGDQFAVRYVGDRPGWNSMQLDNPTEAQIQYYRKLARQQQARQHPDQSEALIECLLDIAYAQQGLSGYAAFISQTAAATDNPFANEQAYKRLIRSVDFQNARQQQCL
jgi:hypothetical protein